MACGEFSLEEQQAIVTLRPIRGEMFIEHATYKRLFLAPAERNNSGPYHHWRNIALRWSADIKLVARSINISLLWSES